MEGSAHPGPGTANCLVRKFLLDVYIERMRYSFIDSIRGLAAIAVVLFHLNVVGLWQPSVYQLIVSHGWLGVPAFFVVSGFAVHGSARTSQDIKIFLSKRFWRIYPPYLASLLLVLLLIVERKLSTALTT